MPQLHRNLNPPIHLNVRLSGFNKHIHGQTAAVYTSLSIHAVCCCYFKVMVNSYNVVMWQSFNLTTLFLGQLRPLAVNQYEVLIWLVGCFGFNGPLRQYFSLYQAVSQREGERGERIDESKNVQTTPTRTYCKRNRPLPYCNQNCRTPRHWKFTQHHRTTRLPH